MPGRTPRDSGPPAFLRAAIAYADLRQEDVEEALHVSASTLNRWLTGPSKPDYKAPAAWQLDEVVKLTGVPLAFLETGFPGVATSAAIDPGPQTQEISDLAARVDELETAIPEKLEELTAALRSIQDSLRPRMDAPARRTFEQLVDALRSNADGVQELLNQLGRDTGRRDLRRRRDADQRHRDQPDAA